MRKSLNKPDILADITKIEKERIKKEFALDVSGKKKKKHKESFIAYA